MPAAFFCLTEFKSVGLTGGTAKPSRFGSASVKGPSKPGPRKTTTNRWPFPGLMIISTSSAFFIFLESNAHSSSVTLVSMRPARRSVTMPWEFTVQKFARIIAEQPEMPRSAARRDSRADRHHAALCAVFGQGVEVGGFGGFERGEIILFPGGNVAQAIQNNQGQFGVGFDRQFCVERIEVHKFLDPCPPSSWRKAPKRVKGFMEMPCGDSSCPAVFFG